MTLAPVGGWQSFLLLLFFSLGELHHTVRTPESVAYDFPRLLVRRIFKRTVRVVLVGTHCICTSSLRGKNSYEMQARDCLIKETFIYVVFTKVNHLSLPTDAVDGTTTVAAAAAGTASCGCGCWCSGFV